MGLTVLNKPAESGLKDASASVRIASAEATLRCQESGKARSVLELAVVSPDPVVALQAAIVFWYLGEKARASAEVLRRASQIGRGPNLQREYTKNTLKKTIDRLG